MDDDKDDDDVWIYEAYPSAGVYKFCLEANSVSYCHSYYYYYNYAGMGWECGISLSPLCRGIHSLLAPCQQQPSELCTFVLVHTHATFSTSLLPYCCPHASHVTVALISSSAQKSSYSSRKLSLLYFLSIPIASKLSLLIMSLFSPTFPLAALLVLLLSLILVPYSLAG